MRPAIAAILLALTLSATHAQVTLNIVNNFTATNGGTYFGDHLEDADVSLYFTGIGGSDVTYTSTNGLNTVTAGSRVKFSEVTGGSFSLSSSITGARVYAILGSDAPATIPLPAGPDPVLTANPYSFIEYSTTSGGQADQSFLNQVSFPTSLTNGTQTNSWSSTATASSVATAFHTAFPAAPYAPAAGVAAGSGTPYNPYAATTVTRTAGAEQTSINGERVIAASNVNLPAASPPTPVQLGTGYTNVPGFDSYLGWLKDHQTGNGWKFGYDSPGFADSTYTGYLQVTGTAGNYGLELGHFTYGGTFADGSITGGTTVTGTITYAANNTAQDIYGVSYTGNWTDMVIFGATDPTGATVQRNGDLGGLDWASVLYTISASLGPGILGSDAYTTAGDDTNSFFTTGITASNILTNFFDNSTFGGGSHETGFYDQYWYTMLKAGGVSNGAYAGYFTPYDDHFDGLNVLMASTSGTLTWDLGVPQDGATPEPSTLALLTVAGAVFGGLLWRRRRATA